MATTKKATAGKKATKTTKSFTAPGLDLKQGQALAQSLQMRLHSLNDLQLTLKHAHWNVVGPKFISIHEMLDPQVVAVRAMVDQIAERMATLGVAPNGCPGDLVAKRTWEDYPIGQAQASEHLGALDVVYTGVITAHRETMAEAGEVDPVTEDMLISHVGQLEQFQWFIRAHLEDNYGNLATQGVAHASEGAAKGIANDKRID